MTYKILATSSLTLIAILSFGLSFAHAQTVGSTTSVSSPMCYAFPTNIRYGANDSATYSSVTSLQNFLVSQGFFSSANVGTGHFGPLTLQAVINFQAAHGIPATGFVGPMTRAYIQNNCGTTPPTGSPVSIYSINPSSGATGATITITGSGFTNSNKVFFNGNVAAQDVPINSSSVIPCASNVICNTNTNETISITVPTSLSPNCSVGLACPMYVELVTPGQYSITVQNSNGTSNAELFTVTSSGTSVSNPISITGLDGPSSLSVGQTGNWTVHAVAGSNIGNLHYSVNWGDEEEMANSSMFAASPTSQTSATFSHAYQAPGTYTATFTVTDDLGDSVSTSNTIPVNAIYY